MKEKLLQKKQFLSKKNYLHIKIMKLLIGSILAVSLLIGFMGLFNAGLVVEKDSAQIMNLLGREKVMEINARLQTVQQSVESVYHYADENLARAEQLVYEEFYIDVYCEKVYEVLQNAAESTDSAASAYLRINPNLLGEQKGVYLRRIEDGSFKEHEMTPITADGPEAIRALSWYYEPIENKAATWLKPYWDGNVQEHMISYVIPIFFDEEPIGVVGMDIELKQLRNIVSGVSVYETGHAFLLSAEGDMIYHKDYPEGVNRSEFDADLKELEKLVSEGEEGKVYTHRWKGRREQMVAQHLMNGMFLVISAPTHEINMTRNILMWQLVTVLLIVTAVSVFLSIKVAGQITKPLTQLTDAAGRIADGDWSTQIPCDSEGETGILAITLKRMMEELNKQVEHVNKLAYSDLLTGLYNRHYMIEYCNEYAKGEEKNVGVVFCDLNRLKYVNDNFGHSAGDGLICGFSDLLKKVFPQDMCCRMSGDEFFVIVPDCEENEFLKKVELLRKLNLEGDVPMAAIGYCYRTGAKYIGEMMNEAEDDMYCDKKKFYEQFPMYKR